MEKQEQDIEGKSQATKDHTTDQETVAAPCLEDLPRGKETALSGPGMGHTAGGSGWRPSAPTEPAPSGHLCRRQQLCFRRPHLAKPLSPFHLVSGTS